jgi:regulator of sirC expression with transglutaminase-like and TPR domain
MALLPSFADLTRDPEAAIDVLALAMAAEFGVVDAGGAIATLDGLGEDLTRAAARTEGHPRQLAIACGEVLGREYGFVGDRTRYDDPQNSMLDIVLARRRGLPILLSVVYIAVARRAGVPLAGVGLPGHFVVGHFGTDPPVLLDPFSGGVRIDPHVPQGVVRPWHPHEIATRMLNNLVASYQRRGNLTPAIRAAQMRLMLPTDSTRLETMTAELRALQARLN